jgi:Flp pilus assembly protein TadG
MMLLRRLRLSAARFRDDASGAVAIEGVLAAVGLIWWYAVSFQIIDAFRVRTANTKGAFTVADAISREKDPVNAAYVEGLNKLFAYVTNAQGNNWIRISSIYWDGTDEQFRVDWSHATHDKPPQTDTTINVDADRIPTMPVGDTALVVETSMDFNPLFGIGLGAGAHQNFVVTRPRGPRVVWGD